MFIFKIIFIALTALFSATLLKQYGKEEYSAAAVLGAAVIIVIMLLPKITYLTDAVNLLSELSGTDGDYIAALIKSLGIAIITQIAADICRDGSNTALADKIELGGKVVILIICIPMIKSIAEFSVSLIGGS